ncbi:hypothetical protein AMECASPLE_038580, partial [Ameca splendens]
KKKPSERFQGDGLPPLFLFQSTTNSQIIHSPFAKEARGRRLTALLGFNCGRAVTPPSLSHSRPRRKTPPSNSVLSVSQSFSTAYSIVGRGGAGAYLQQSMGERQGTPWTGRQSI